MEVLFLKGPALWVVFRLSLIHISEPTRQAEISYAVFCLKKKKTQQNRKSEEKKKELEDHERRA